MSLFIRKLRKDYSKYEDMINEINSTSEKIDFKLKDYLSWNPSTNFIVRFNGISGVELKIFGFDKKTLLDLHEELILFDFDKISVLNKTEFIKFSLDDLLNMHVIGIRNSSSGTFVELLLDYESFLTNSINLFKESL